MALPRLPVTAPAAGTPFHFWAQGRPTFTCQIGGHAEGLGSGWSFHIVAFATEAPKSASYYINYNNIQNLELASTTDRIQRCRQRRELSSNGEQRLFITVAPLVEIADIEAHLDQ